MTTVQLVDTQDGSAPRMGHVDQPDERLIGFGAWLKRAREARGLTLEDITRQTKISRRHLEALESGDLSVLPDFYQGAEVRAIAREVGVDEQVAVALLQAIARPGEPTREASDDQRTQEHPPVYVALALSTVFVTGVLTAALFVWMMAGRPITSEAGARPPAPALWAQNDPAGTATIQRVSTAVGVGRFEVGRSEDLPLREAGGSTPATDLVITTWPAGARVTVNGVGWGMSPLTIRHLPAGDKRIRVSKDGYAAAERVLALDGAPQRALDIRLTTASQR